jgi:hypothetical protein
VEKYAKFDQKSRFLKIFSCGRYSILSSTYNNYICLIAGNVLQIPFQKSQILKIFACGGHGTAICNRYSPNIYLPNFWKRFTKNGKSSKCNPEIMQF